MLLTEQLKQGGGAHDEHARVPAVLTTVDVTAGGVDVGLLDELVDPPAGRRAGHPEVGPHPDIAEAGGRASGFDADGHQLAHAGQHDRLLHRPTKPCGVGDDVVCRERAEDGLRVAPLQDRCGQPDGRHRVTG